MAFLIKKRIPLDDYGDEWKDCYLTFRSVSVNELAEMQKVFGQLDDQSAVGEVLTFLGDRLLEGEGIDENGKPVDITKEMLGDLPVEILAESLLQLTGQSGKDASG
jgi:hypothetical protein